MMAKRLQKDLSELIDAGILNESTASDITAYYALKEKSAPNVLMIVFGILGALLIGLGIILILAHNWEFFSRGMKTAIAFIPLLIGQGLCGFTLWKKNESITWREASSTFLFVAIGACISLLSQIYNIEGSMSGFVLMWMGLALPVIYVMRSSTASIFFLIGITYYGCEVGYWNRTTKFPYLYWVLLLTAVPHYYGLIRKHWGSNSTFFHHVLISLSILICLGTFGQNEGIVMMVAYMALLGVYYVIGSSHFFEGSRLIQNPFLIIGALGIMILLFTLSFDNFWSELVKSVSEGSEIFFSIEMAISLILVTILVYFLWVSNKEKKEGQTDPVQYIGLAFFPIFLLGAFYALPAIVLVNLLILYIGIHFIRRGTAIQRVELMNFGLLTIAILIACRFFDIELSFVTRGVLFVLLGIGFFIANYFLNKGAKKTESQ